MKENKNVIYNCIKRRYKDIQDLKLAGATDCIEFEKRILKSFVEDYKRLNGKRDITRYEKEI